MVGRSSSLRGSMTIALPLILCLAAPTAPVPTCDRGALAELSKGTSGLMPQARINLASKVIASACDGRLPKPVVDALDAIHATEVSEHGPAMLMALRDAPDFAVAGCEKWEEEFASHAAPGEKLRSIFSHCQLDKPGFVTEDELVEVPDLGAVYIAVPLYKWLLMHAFDANQARPLVRSLLGLTGEPKRPKADPKLGGNKKKP